MSFTLRNLVIFSRRFLKKNREGGEGVNAMKYHYQSQKCWQNEIKDVLHMSCFAKFKRKHPFGVILNRTSGTTVFENAYFYLYQTMFLKVGLKPKKISCYLLFWKSFKMTKNAFYFSLKALFILKKFKFWSWLLGHAGKTAWLRR